MELAALITNSSLRKSCYVIMEFLQHLESLAQTNSQSLKKAELEGYAKKWMNAKYPIHLTIYLDILTPLKVLSLRFKKKIHDPITAVRHIIEFNWTMTKLKLLIDHSLEDNTTRLTHFTKFLKEKSANKNCEHICQDPAKLCVCKTISHMLI